MTAPAYAGLAGCDAIAAAARRVLGADAVLIVGGDGPPGVVGAAGLDAHQAAELQRGLRDEPAAFLEREFAVVRSADAELAGERLGAVHALKRAPGSFDHEERIVA